MFFSSDAVDSENENAPLDSKVGKETIDFKEMKRIDHILASLQRKVAMFSHIDNIKESQVHGNRGYALERVNFH